MIRLSATEKKVFHALTHNKETVAVISRKARLPRMTTYTTLLRLRKAGLASTALSDSAKKSLWILAKEAHIDSEINAVRNMLLKIKGRGGVVRCLSHNGKKDIAETLMNLTTKKEGARMYSVQHADNWLMWMNIMGKEWVNKHNKAVVDSQLVAFTIHSKDAPREIKSDADVIKSYKGRLGNSHAVPDQFLRRGLSLYIFDEVIFLVNLKTLEAVELWNKDMASFFVTMFTFMFENSEQEKFFLEYGR